MAKRWIAALAENVFEYKYKGTIVWIGGPGLILCSSQEVFKRGAALASTTASDAAIGNQGVAPPKRHR